MSITTADFKTGMTILYNNQIFTIVDFQHVKPGKGQAFVRTKLRNLRTGTTTEYSFNAGEKLEQAMIEKRKMQYLYDSGDMLVFMDNETYDQIEIPSDRLQWELNFLKPSDEVTRFENEVLGVQLPVNVAFTITETEPAVKGDTATGASKNATIETGFQIKVPLFISEGEKVIVNTEDGKYQGRA